MCRTIALVWLRRGSLPRYTAHIRLETRPKKGLRILSRGDQVTRQWQLIRLLTGKYGRTLAQLRSELGVTKRTVQRDIADLERAGFPVISDNRNGTVYWHFMEGFHAEGQ